MSWASLRVHHRVDETGRLAGMGGLAGMDGRWNVNIHYDARLAACVPASAAAVLDVGCEIGRAHV